MSRPRAVRFAGTVDAWGGRGTDPCPSIGDRNVARTLMSAGLGPRVGVTLWVEHPHGGKGIWSDRGVLSVGPSAVKVGDVDVVSMLMEFDGLQAAMVVESQ